MINPSVPQKPGQQWNLGRNTHAKHGTQEQQPNVSCASNKISANSTINICTYNACTLHKEHLDNFLAELELINWDVVGVSETKLKEVFLLTVTGNHTLYNSGIENAAPKRMYGVGFLVHSNHNSCVIEFIAKSERLALLKLRSKYNNVTLIQCYAPTETHPDEEVEEFYANLQELIDYTSKRDTLFIMGDFNAKVGNLHLQEPSVVGPYNNIERGFNDRGKLLVSFCKQNGLVITNTRFKHRSKFTWVQPGDRIRNTVDYIMVRNSAMHHVQDARTLSTPDISDHRLLRCRVMVSFLKRQTNKFQNVPRYDIDKLKSEDTRNSFQKHITEVLELSNQKSNNRCAQEIMDVVENAIVTASDCALGKKEQRAHHNWITKETHRCIAEKHQIRKQYGFRSTEYKVAKRRVKKMCSFDRDNHIDQIHQEIGRLPLTIQYYKAIKSLKMSTTRIVKGWSVKGQNNEILTSHNDILKRWEEFYTELYSSDRTTFEYFDEDPNDPIPTVLLSEVNHCLSLLKSNKAPGPDGITSEMLSAGGEQLRVWLKDLINVIIETRDIPHQLVISEIITLFKKGDLLECGNYRPISLLCHIYKLLMMVIYLRIKDPLTKALQPSQAAYQQGRGTIEQIQTMQQIIEKCNEFNRSCVICFVDFTKAFDSVDQQKLWNALRKYTAINPAYINLIARLYEHSKTRIRTDVGTTSLISLLRGVKQGDLASAILFCIALMVVLLNTFEGQQCGISIGGIEHTDESYADDIGLITQNSMQMNTILERLRVFAAEFGLDINIPKTKVMFIGEHDPNSMVCKIGDKVLDVVTFFEYLGRVLSNDGDDTKAVESRIGKGWEAFKKVQSVISSRNISMQTKKKTFETYVLPCVMYASETIKWKPDLIRKMQVFQNHIMRWMTGKRQIERTPLTKLFEMTKLEPIEKLIKTKKLKWYGHLKRSNLPIRDTVDGLIEGKRRRGRPRRRWRQDIHEWTQMSWTDINKAVKDRLKWRSITYAG